MSSTYLPREQFFAMKAIRLLAKAGEIQRIGLDAYSLVTIIVSMEDAKRYRAPVTFHNGQLLSILGFAKWERLDNARRRAIAAGWLHYSPPPKRRQGIGSYWVTIPSGLADLPDSVGDESLDPLATFYHRGYADAAAGRPAQPYPRAGHDRGESYPADGDDREGSYPRQGYGEGDDQGDPSILSLSLLSPAQARPDEQMAPAGKKRKPKEASYLETDMEVAKQIWDRIRALQPDRTPPKFRDWANTIRLMRERDRREHGEILELFERVQRDPFWRLNILSPEKLREKWDDLSLKLKSAARMHMAGNTLEPLAALKDIAQ